MFPLVNMVSLQLLLLAVAALTKKKTPSSFVLSGQTAVGPIKFESTGLMRCKLRIQSDCVLKRAVVAMKPALPPAAPAAARVPARATEEDSQAADPLPPAGSGHQPEPQPAQEESCCLHSTPILLGYVRATCGCSV